ncbi:MAG: EsaB/YukD family protein, partial [Lachnospiraceae bacterium]|nr:EsaB/YukD family protein [Lachnospiraceae bacterium]
DIDLCYLQLANLEPEKSGFAGESLIELYLPAIGTGYDTSIPGNQRIGEIISLLEREVEEETGGVFCPKNSVLCEREAGIILDVNLTPKQHGILNGTRLMLI